MVTVNVNPETATTHLPLETAGLRRPLFAAVRWGAILAGVAAGVSMQLLLTLLGIASGLTVADVNADNTGTAMGAMLWAGVSMLIAAYIGGYVAARMSGLKRKSDGVLHGLVSWAVTMLLFVTLAASAGGALLGGLFNVGMSGVAPAASVTSGVTRMESPVAGWLRSQAGNIDAPALDRLQQHIRAGERDAAISELAARPGMDAGRAAEVVDQALILSGSSASASPQARLAANRAVEGAGTTAWVLFAAVALALLLGMAGGATGALGARRISWVGGVARPA